MFPALHGKTDSHERDRPGQGPAPRSGPVPRLRAQPPPGSKGQSRELSSGRRPVSEQRPSGWEAGAQAQGRGTQGASPGSILLGHPTPAPGAVSPIPVTPAPRAVSPEAGYACGGCSGSREPARGAEAKAGAGVPGGRADRGSSPQRGSGRGLACSPSPEGSVSSPLQTRRELHPGALPATCVPAHHQPGQMLSKTEFCLNAQKGDLGDQNLKQINMCGSRLLITACNHGWERKSSLGRRGWRLAARSSEPGPASQPPLCRGQWLRGPRPLWGAGRGPEGPAVHTPPPPQSRPPGSSLVSPPPLPSSPPLSLPQFLLL